MKREKLMKTSISAPKPQSLLGIEHYRDLTNLGSLIASSPETFWCYIHLAEMPLFEQSPDPRYCKACNAVLNRDREDSRASGNFRRPWWVPQNAKRKGKGSAVEEIQGPQEMSTQKGLLPISDNIAPTLDGSKDKVSENGIIHRRPRETLRRLHHLPIKRNKQLAFDGMGIKKAAKV
ncbi:MAG: hypothetical protein WCB17_00210 [Dehalococcoidales bacterium]|jgi:hypothetical protein